MAASPGPLVENPRFNRLQKSRLRSEEVLFAAAEAPALPRS